MPTILVIDDETATLTLFRHFLSAMGYSVLAAGDGPSGLQVLGQEKSAILEMLGVTRYIEIYASKTGVIESLCG